MANSQYTIADRGRINGLAAQQSRGGPEAALESPAGVQRHLFAIGYWLSAIRAALLLEIDNSHQASEIPLMRDGEFFVQEPAVFAFIDEVHSVLERESDIPKRLASLRRPYQKLLEDKSWLPVEFRQINPESGMGGGIASWLLYQNSVKDLSLFSLVVPPGVTTPIHNHLAWGLVGLYLGEQEEEEFEVVHHDHLQAGAHVRMNRRFLRVLKPGEFYELIPPYNDVHRVKTISPEPSISLHLLANDTGCVVRQKFDLATGHVDAFRSGWSNRPCPESVTEGQ